MKRQLVTALLTVCALTYGGLAQEPANRAPMRRLGTLDWHTDYAAAYRQAEEERKQLFIYFYDPKQPNVKESYERDVLANPALAQDLEKVVRAVLPTDATVPNVDAQPSAQAQPSQGAATANAPKTIRLLAHPAFRYMQNQHGLAVLDLVNPRDSLYGRVVSAHQFRPGLHYTPHTTKVVLQLPRATITQRALVYALRIHPEAPQSTQGTAHPVLFEQAALHSAMMAAYGAVGHHDWGNRSSQIAALVGRSPEEVAASGFGGENLIEAAKSCVDNWRTSSVHWWMISAGKALYGYDMVRAPSGQWYATGIFTP